MEDETLRIEVSEMATIGVAPVAAAALRPPATPTVLLAQIDAAHWEGRALVITDLTILGLAPAAPEDS